ncbi:MAG: glycosyltransferase [Candidatus Acidiferrales bacterium]
MQTLLVILLSLLALGWLAQGIRAWRGMKKIPRLSKIPPRAGDSPPRVSILLAARNEAEKLRAALESMLALDYPNFEVIAVDDRSDDATPQILRDLAARSPRLKTARIETLPPGWLGKPHALETAYGLSTGEFLLFTDADIWFAPDVLSRAVALTEENHWDHLTLAVGMDLRGFWENTVLSYIQFGFVFGVQPWRVSDPRSGCYMGVGAFQLVRKKVYEAIGTHKRLAMEVVDDMKLGKLVKQNGFASGTASSDNLIRVRWQEGIRNVIKGMTKNLFAGLGFSASQSVFTAAMLLLISVVPFAALPFTHGWARLAAAISVVTAVTVHGRLFHETGHSFFYGLTQPLGAFVFVYMIYRSMILTLWRGGIVWRDTFYPLAELRKGSV